jgi:glycosyltransferase A (GT-A) superfamily protein (DUF2064 family)
MAPRISWRQKEIKKDQSEMIIVERDAASEAEILRRWLQTETMVRQRVDVVGIRLLLCK